MNSIQTDIERLNKEYSELKEKTDELKRQRNQLAKQIYDNDAIIVGFREKIKHLKYLIDVENVLDDVKNIEDFNLLERNELAIIISGMDKTDYTKYNCARWIDLENIIKEVIKMKKKYNWKLYSLTKRGQLDTIPPQNLYRCEYKDEDGLIFIY